MFELPFLIDAIGYLAALSYSCAALWQLRSPAKSSTFKLPLRLGILGAVLHLLALSMPIMLHSSISGSFFDAFSLTALIVVLVTFITQMNLHSPALLAPVFLFAALSILMSVLLGHHAPITASSFGMLLHIITSITAYALLLLATLQALIVYWVDKSLKHKTQPFWQQSLPSLQSMELQMFKLVDVGWVVLTVAIITGSVFIDDMFAQHLMHKTVFSILSWLLFGALMLGRQFAGWRGVTAVRWTLAAFAALVAAYFGSKFVLDVILQQI